MVSHRTHPRRRASSIALLASLAMLPGCKLGNTTVYFVAVVLFFVWVDISLYLLLIKKPRTAGRPLAENDALALWIQGAVVIFGGAFSLTQFTAVTAAQSVGVSFDRREDGTWVRACIDRRQGQDRSLRLSTSISAENLGQVETDVLYARAKLETPHLDESAACWGAPLDSDEAADASRSCETVDGSVLESRLGSLTTGNRANAVFYWWIPLEERKERKEEEKVTGKTGSTPRWRALDSYRFEDPEASMTQELRLTACVRNTDAGNDTSCTVEADGVWTATVRVDQLDIDALGSCEHETPKVLGHCYVDGALISGYATTGLTRRGCLEHCQHCIDRTQPVGNGAAGDTTEPSVAACSVLWQPRTAGQLGVRCSGTDACSCLTTSDQ